MSICELIKDTFDKYLVNKSKLTSSSPNDQLSVPGIRVVGKYHNGIGEGLLLYINKDTPFKAIQNFSVTTTS